VIAVEAAELLGRPNCATCNDALRKARACRRPEYQTNSEPKVWRFASPMLQPSASEVAIRAIHGEQMSGFILYECPTSHILREAPWVYDLLARLVCSDAMGPMELSNMPRFFQHMFKIHGSLREWVRREHKLKREISRQARQLEGALNG